MGESAAERMPNRNNLRRARPVALVALDMRHEVVDMIPDLIVLVIDRNARSIQ